MLTIGKCPEFFIFFILTNMNTSNLIHSSGVNKVISPNIDNPVDNPMILYIHSTGSLI